MIHNPSWLYANYEVYDASLGINKPSETHSNIILNLKFFSQLFFSIFKTHSKIIKLIFLKTTKDKFSELVLYEIGDHSQQVFQNDQFSNPKFISIFDQKNLFRCSKFSIFKFYKLLLKNYRIAIEVLQMPPNNLKSIIINHLFNSLPNSIFYEYFFNDLKQHNSGLRIVSSSCLIFPLTIAGNIGIDIRVKMHGLMGKVIPEGFPKLNKLELLHKDEIKYFNKLLPSLDVESSVNIPIKNKEKSVIIFLRQTLQSMNDSNTKTNFFNAQLMDAINFFTSKQFKVILKLHPNSWFIQEDLSIRFTKFEFIDKNHSASEAISMFCPSFVLGWLSSSLIEALNMDVIPITLESKPYNSIVSKKTIVNFEKRILNYETDIHKISDATDSPSDYRKIINSLNP